MNALELTGRARTHVVDVADPPCTLHVEAVPAFQAMRRAAAEAGIDLGVVSAFRDFDAQVRIWNEKYLGQRVLLDRNGRELQARNLDPDARIDAILCWSALPGASRHHWGSEIDVIDRAAVTPGMKIRLIPEEYTTGPFAHLDRWLTRHMGRFGFFRPYGTDRGGVAPEPWHLSYAPVSVPALEQLTPGLLRDALRHSGLEGLAALMPRVAGVHERYVMRVDMPQST
jgi:LAS superfamily LD-carboxypeptidase LdcB